MILPAMACFGKRQGDVVWKERRVTARVRYGRWPLQKADNGPRRIFGRAAVHRPSKSPEYRFLGGKDNYTVRVSHSLYGIRPPAKTFRILAIRLVFFAPCMVVGSIAPVSGPGRRPGRPKKTRWMPKSVFGCTPSRVTTRSEHTAHRSRMPSSGRNVATVYPRSPK